MSKVIYPVIGNEKELPFYLTGVGVSSSEYHIKRDDGLISHQILFTKSGKGTLVLGGKEYPQHEGSCFFLKPGIPHEYYPDDNICWETYWIVFRGGQLNGIMDSLGFGECMVRDLSATATLQKIFGKIYLSAQNSYNGGYICSLLIYEYILEVRRLMLDSLVKGSAGTIIENSVALIDDNLSRDLTLELLAGTAGVSPQHFCRVFRARMGMRPMEYIAKKRIAAAKALLDNTEKSVAEIGRLTGYPNQSYFGVVFKKYEGVSPLEYRNYKRTLSI